MNIQFSASALGLRNTNLKNIKTTYGATGDGTTNDAQKLVDFQTDCAGAVPVTLIEPAGTYNLGSGTTAQFFMRGVLNARLVGAGQGVTVLSYTGSSPVQFGGKGLSFDNLHSARTATVLASATSVTLTDASKASRFTVGLFAMMAGFDPQGFGDPCNPHFFDIVKVLSVVGAVVGFDRELTHDYLSTWPLYNDGANWATGGGMDQGGPATLYALDGSFGCEVEVRDQTISQGNNQTYAQGLGITYRNVTFTGNAGAIPTQAYIWSAIGCTYSGASAIEIDKCTKEARFDACSLHNVNVQSSSVDLLQLTNTTINQLSGTPKRLVVSGGTIADFRPGTSSYGRADSISLTGATISATQPGGYTEDGPGHTGFTNECTMSGGVITWPNSKGAPRWAVPGSYLFWVGSTTFEVEGIFKVLTVTQDATNTFIATDQAGGFPTLPQTAGNYLNIRTHPCPLWNCVSGVGCIDIVDLSQAGAQSRPLYEYTKRRYTGDSARVTSAIELLTASADTNMRQRAWGQLNFIEIVVEEAYTGGGAAVTFQLSQFNNWSYIKSDGSTGTLDIRINTKIAGTRRITPGQNSTGGQSGDTLPDLTSVASVWMGGRSASAPILSRTVSSDVAGPVFTVEIDCDQGF